MAAVTWQAAGTAVNGTNATGIGANPAWPGHAINDIALLFVESTGGQPVTLSVPNGFVAVPNSPQATGAGTAGTQLSVFWARATSTAMPRPRLASPSDHFYARIITFRGVINTGDPWDVTGGGVKAAASGTVTVTGVTTTVANTLVVQAVARDNDSAAAAFSAQTNANLTGITERLDAGTANGNGGGLGVWAGTKATAGATGNTTANVTNSINAFLTIALKPQPAPPAFQAVGAAVGGTGAISPAWPVHAVNDIALLFVESAGGEAVTLSTPAGFVAVTNSPQSTGALTAGTRISVFWARATSTTMATPTVADAGDHVYGRIITYRGAVNAGDPWDVTGGGVKAAASVTVTVTGVTTTVSSTRIVQAVARDNDNAAAAFSAQTNANLTGITERSDAGTNQGNGGGFAVWDGAMATAGATGDTTATVTNSINAFLTIALAPNTALTPPAPVYQALGGASTTGLNWPAHAIDDIALLFIESTGGQAPTLADAAGFVEVLNSPQSTGLLTAGTRITVFWARATSAAMVGPTITGPADHAYARIFTYRGAIASGDPWDVTGGGVKAAASGTVTVTGVTTTLANTLVVQAVARDNDNAAAAFSAQANGTLTGIAERGDAGTTTGNGGGFAVWDGAKATAGATGNTTATVTNSRNAFLTIALKPQPRYQAAGAAAGGTGAISPAWPAHAVNDIALLFIESTGGQPVTLSVPNGFVVAVPNSPQATGAGTAGTQLSVFWARATSTTMAAPTVADAGDHVYGRIITYRDVVTTGDPWDVTGGGVKAAASGTVTVTGVTTTLANTLVVQAVARDNDSAAAAFSLQTNVNLTGIAERSDAGTNQGNGGGFAVWDGAKATAGATGDTTANVTNSINAFLTIALKPQSPVAGPDHILITHAGSALTCSPQTVTITACANALCTAPHYSGGATVTLTPGGLSFAIDATGINSAATVQQSTAGAVVLAATSVPAANFATTCWNTTTSTASCAMTFNDSGFMVTVPDHVSCNNATTTIAAVETAPGTGLCVPAYQSVTRAVNLYSSYVSPATGTQVVTASTGVVSTSAPGTAHNLVFDVNGVATITLSYPDAGQLTLTANDTAPTGAAMTGSDSFVAAPASFAFSGIPAAPLVAGQAFNATVTAMNACGTPAATPNFDGTVTITSSNPQPGLGNATAINTTLSGFINGVASLNLTWDEVGFIDLNANLANYLGSSLSVSGTRTNVGPFQPAYFDTVVTQGCSTFTYAGSTAPVKAGQPFTVTVKAKRFGGDMTDATNTANYAGPNAYPTTLSDAGAAAGLAGNNIAAASFVNGVGIANVTYEVATPQTVPLTLTLRATDSDLPAVSSSGHTEGTTEMRSGRAKLSNAHGSELLALPVPFRTEYWNSGWVLNPADVCSGDGLMGGAVSVVLSASPVTCVQDSGIGLGLSGAGCAAAGPLAQQFTEGGVAGFAGDFNLWLRATGSGNTGAVTVTGSVPSWLQYAWGGGAAVVPSSRATFGVYKGANEFIYLRENY